MKTLVQVANKLPEAEARQLAVEKFCDMERNICEIISATAKMRRLIGFEEVTPEDKQLAEINLNTLSEVYKIAKGNLQRYNIFNPNYDKSFKLALATGEVKYFNNEEVPVQ